MRIIAAALLTLISTSDAAEAARWHWPWEVQYRRSHRSHAARHVRPAPEKPNCDQVRSAVEVLTPEKLAKSLTRSTVRQRQHISECLERKP